MGLVGSTGASTAPHLHYEVWINGSAINPIDYDAMVFLKEYRELVKKLLRITNLLTDLLLF
ncbi:MAG: M23 family metallopeptidase [Saprospiraceae bacterium]|nr:M23 family metallopeptidase [Saprospiraceae bacterium]